MPVGASDPMPVVVTGIASANVTVSATVSKQVRYNTPGGDHPEPRGRYIKWRSTYPAKIAMMNRNASRPATM